MHYNNHDKVLTFRADPFALIFFKEVLLGMENKEKNEQEELGIQNDKEEDDIFATQEIKIEELAIDGICGVY
jgi:mycofactocin precursor